MTASFGGLPGQGPARRRLLQHRGRYFQKAPGLPGHLALRDVVFPVEPGGVDL